MDAIKKNQPTRRRGLRRWIKRALGGLVLAVLLAGAVVAAWPKPVAIESALVDRGPLVVTVDEDGVSRVKNRYVVSAPLPGTLARIELDAGDAVEQGEVLARILPSPAPLLDERSRSQSEAQVSRGLATTRQAQAQIERAETALDLATKEAKRTEMLYAKGAVSQAEYEQAMLARRARAAELTSARFADKVAQYELRMARAALGRFGGVPGKEVEQFEVPSPVSGRVLKVIQKSEGVAQPGAQLLELGDPKALEIVADVLTSDAVRIEPGAPVTIENWGGEPLAARVRLVEPSAFTRVSALGVEEQRVNTVIDLIEPYEKWTELGDGYRVEAHIQVHHAKNVTRVPASALFREEQRWAVFTVDHGEARLKLLEVGRRNDSYVEVLEGLEPGEQVILHPSDRIVEGVRVEVQ